ncbi:MAG: hypothetical protein H6538_02845 [Bacteroidales bacterium]|nr:hypothetical protein [Bacteroidales bacterium]MCB8999709.1 hypothetical protein [Bacteroidales bacterium]
MKPFQTLLFLLSVFTVFLLILLVFPEKGIQLGPDIHLKFASLNDFLEKDTVQYADISSIIDKSVNAEQEVIPDSILFNFPDTLSHSEDSIIRQTIIANADSLRKLTYAFEYTGENPEVLYPLFKKLEGLRTHKKLVRILHYGDSQIEADRMSAFIRNKLQTSFGGTGCGTVTAVPLYNGKLSIKQLYSDNWDRQTGFVNIDTSLGHKEFGALMSFVRQINADTLSGNKNTSWLKFIKSSQSYSSSRKYNRVTMYVEADNKPVNIFVAGDGKKIDSLLIEPGQGLKKLVWKINETPDELKISFYGKGLARIYGVSLDNNWGVALDNIPLRGSSGLFFSKTDTAFLAKMYRMMDVGLIIMQFGGNVVPYMTDNFDSYKGYFIRELKLLHKMLPGVPVIVIGPSDMSIKEKDNYVTYPNLEAVRDAVKEATLESGFVFWDMYAAMGGKNSMPSWVMAEPPLAVNDFVHFNTRGARIIAEMFTNAFLTEYNYWALKNTSSK